MNNAQLEAAIKLNADQFNATIQKVGVRLKELSGLINSLPTGDKKLNALTREFTRLSATQQRLIDGYNKLGTEVDNTAPKLEKVGNSSKSARTALTSLSLTLQDLPFGFLGVQNNLPGVIQGFGNLTATTNGKILPALKEIGKSLIGPAGIFLAFSAVTSIVTVLVQKYGSLGGAIDALLGRQTKFTIELEKSRKELEDYYKNQRSVAQITNDASASQAGQIVVIQSLTKKATDLTTSQKDQNVALDQLKQISDDYYGNLKIGSDNVDEIRKATEKYIQVLIAKAKVQAYADEIANISKLVNENDRLLVTAQKNVDVAKKRDETNKKLIESSAKQGGAITALKSNLKEAEATVAKLAEENFNLNNRTQDLTDSITSVNDVIIKNGVVTGDAAKSVKQYFESYKPPKEYLDFFKFYDDKTKFQRAQNLFDQLKEIDPTKGLNSVTKFNEILKQLQEDFPNYFEGISISAATDIPKTFLTVRTLLFNALDNLSGAIVEDTKTGNINKAGAKIAEAYFGNAQQIRDGLKKAKEEARKAMSQYQPLDASNVFGKGPGAYEQVMIKVIQAQKVMKEEQKKMVDNIRDTANLFGDVFFNPLQEQFRNFIETGRFTFKEFGKVVLDNLKALTAKIIATGIIQLLATIASGGFGATSFAKTGLTGFQLFGKAFASALGFGGVTSANFGGVGPGGFAMNGAVSLSLRGSDLVGALNRTNTNIGRIG